MYWTNIQLDDHKQTYIIYYMTAIKIWQQLFHWIWSVKIVVQLMCFVLKLVRRTSIVAFHKPSFLLHLQKDNIFYLLLTNQLLRQILYTIIITEETMNNLIYLLNLTTKLSELCSTVTLNYANVLEWLSSICCAKYSRDKTLAVVLPC